MTDQQTDWVPLVEHMESPSAWPMDDTDMQLLAIEAALLDAGIDCAFVPWRPGENGTTFATNPGQPIQLLVRPQDLDSARQVAREVTDTG